MGSDELGAYYDSSEHEECYLTFSFVDEESNFVSSHCYSREKLTSLALSVGIGVVLRRLFYF